MGLNRADRYSYDLLDNLARKSTESVMLEYQNLKIGDLIPMSPDGKMGFGLKTFAKTSGCCGRTKMVTHLWFG
jgi:hypothetical protein